MKTCYKLLLLLLLSVSFITSGEAAFVNYTDIHGKKHIVNTDYNKVPDQYLSQVEEQLKKIENNKPVSVVPENAEQTTQPQNLSTIPTPQNLNTPVEVFVKSDCQDCTRLLTLLDVHKIKFSVYDVESSPAAIDFYKTLQNAQLPMTRVGGKIIFGNDINAIRNALNPQVTVPVVTPTPTANTPIEQNTPPPTPTKNYGGYTPGEYFKIKPLLGNKK